MDLKIILIQKLSKKIKNMPVFVELDYVFNFCSMISKDISILYNIG